MKKMVFNLPQETLEDYRLLAKKTKRTVASLMRQAIDEYVRDGKQYGSDDSSDAEDSTPENIPYAGE